MMKPLPLICALLLPAPLATLRAAETTVAPDIDRATLDAWAAPYRGWHCWPDHVIPASPNIPSHEKFHNPANETFYLYYCACGSKGRGIGLITSKPVPAPVDSTQPAP